MTGGYRPRRQARRYERAVRAAFSTVTFYREQWAVNGAPLAEPVPTPTSALPDPPHTLCPFARPWSAAREPSLWTPDLSALARAMRLAGCGDTLPVLEVRDALLDRTRMPRSRRPYRVLLSPAAVVASAERRGQLRAEALAVGAAWVVGGPDELAAIPEAASPSLRPVHRLRVGAAARPGPVESPALLYDPFLGYLGAFVARCGSLHIDWVRVHVRDRDGTVTFSLLRSRRPTLLDVVPAGADGVTVGHCARHGTPVLLPR